MREIKFRGWDDQEKKMYYFDLKKYMSYNEMAQDDLCTYEARQNLMQYTGLKDKQGKEVYEGDILQDETGFGQVKWVQEHCAFLVYVSNPSGYHYLQSDGQLSNSEVIGNIYENIEMTVKPSLLPIDEYAKWKGNMSK